MDSNLTTQRINYKLNRDVIVIINLYIYSVVITLTALILIWVLYKSEEEIKILKQNHAKQTKYTLNVCRGCGSYYDNQITQYESQLYEDAKLIDRLTKENWNLKNDRW